MDTILFESAFLCWEAVNDGSVVTIDATVLYETYKMLLLVAHRTTCHSSSVL